MDVLSEVLSWLRVEGTRSRRSEFTAPWGFSYPRVDIFAFLTVEQGSCSLTVEGEVPVLLEHGDLVMFSPGHVVSLADHPSTPTVPYASILEGSAGSEALESGVYPPLQYGGGGRRTVVRGWGLRFDSYAQHPLLALLPPFVHISSQRRAELPWLDTTLRFIRQEARDDGDGSQMMIVRLMDLLFVQVLRAWFEEQPPGTAGWLGALRDDSVRRALKLLHAHPTDAWTVQRLGRAVGMSRSSFSARFGALVGVSPMKYLTQLRMNLAANALRADPGLSIADVADQVGYHTESSFGRAFRRHFDVSPAAFRRARAASAEHTPRR